jgi:hypothetical protein
MKTATRGRRRREGGGGGGDEEALHGWRRGAAAAMETRLARCGSLGELRWRWGVVVSVRMYVWRVGLGGAHRGVWNWIWRALEATERGGGFGDDKLGGHCDADAAPFFLLFSLQGTRNCSVSIENYFFDDKRKTARFPRVSLCLLKYRLFRYLNSSNASNVFFYS